MTRRTPASLLPIDVEVLRLAVRFTAIRPVHATSWTGASPWTVRASLRRLTDVGALTSRPVVIALRDRSGTIRPAPTVVYSATGKGATYAGAWTVPGYEDLVSLTAARPSAALADHTDGVTGLACWYRHYGYTVVAEREILSLERPSALHRDRRPIARWSVPLSSIGQSIHPPDLVAVAPDGTGWAVELERATKSVANYVEVIGAYRAAQVPQVWHVLSNATAKRLAEACRKLGIVVRPDPASGANVSADGLFRLQGWAPGRAAGGGPEGWHPNRLIPGSPPAGLPAPRELPDLSRTWRRGVALSPDEAALGPGSVMVA